MKLKKGVDLLEEQPGCGPLLERGQYYRLGVRITLSRGDIVERPEKNVSRIWLAKNSSTPTVSLFIGCVLAEKA